MREFIGECPQVAFLQVFYGKFYCNYNVLNRAEKGLLTAEDHM